MVEFSREFCKNDPEVLGVLFNRIVEIHKVAPHDEKELISHRYKKGYCIISRYFMLFGNPGSIYIHYDTISQLRPEGRAGVQITSIGVYDNQAEYEMARKKQLIGSKTADIPKSDLN